MKVSVGELLGFIVTKITELESPETPEKSGVSLFSAGRGNERSGDMVNVHFPATVHEVFTILVEQCEIEIFETSAGIVYTESEGSPFPSMKSEEGAIYFHFHQR